MNALKLYYTSMIIYMIAGVPLILYGLVIKPIVSLYHEHVYSMVSPVFGNYALFLNALFATAVILVTVSLVFFLMSWHFARVEGKKMSTLTVVFPLILFVFAYGLLGVSGFA